MTEKIGIDVWQSQIFKTKHFPPSPSRPLTHSLTHSLTHPSSCSIVVFHHHRHNCLLRCKRWSMHHITSHQVTSNQIKSNHTKHISKWYIHWLQSINQSIHQSSLGSVVLTILSLQTRREKREGEWEVKSSENQSDNDRVNQSSKSSNSNRLKSNDQTINKQTNIQNITSARQAAEFL